MRAGPELDAEIVRTLWRYLVVIDPATEEYRMMSAFGKEKIPPYSTDPDAAKQVADFYRDRGWRLRARRDGTGFSASFYREDNSTYRHFIAETKPAAICHAALAVANNLHIQSK